ncbi:MAG: hypothetical protein LBI55_00565 [Oscillospiraceae bacterium]|nr:hypothetical protein [Oscillospiraceae bacterium]
MANNKNPTCVIILSHGVVSNNKPLVGYEFDVKIKNLLDWENINRGCFMGITKIIKGGCVILFFCICLLLFAMGGNFLANKFKKDMFKAYSKTEVFLEEYILDIEKNMGIKIEDIWQFLT